MALPCTRAAAWALAAELRGADPARTSHTSLATARVEGCGLSTTATPNRPRLETMVAMGPQASMS